MEELIDGSEASSPTMAWSKVVVLSLAAACLAGCRSTVMPPASTQEDLRANCIRLGGRWFPGDSRSGILGIRDVGTGSFVPPPPPFLS
jgi:hypothetical protein